MKKATVDLFTRIFSVLAPPPNMTVSQWADKYRRLSSESSAEPGRWRTSKAPYQREIMDAVCDMRVQKVVIMSAAQIGKTDALILNPIGYYMHYDPSPIMVMQPTISKHHPLSYDMTETGWTRVEAWGAKTGRRNVLHIMNRERIGQRRGVPFLAPVIEALKQLGRYTDAELVAAVVSGMFTVFIEKESASSDGGFGEIIPEDAQVDAGDDSTIELAPGAIVDLNEGEKAHDMNPGRPNTAFDGFVVAICRQIGAALEIPYELLVKNFNASYSASRGALLEAWKMFRMYRTWLANDFCQPVYEEWFAEAVAKGRIPAPGFFSDPLIRKAYTGAEWNGPAQGLLNPVQEVTAAEKRVQNGFSTRDREAMEMNGSDFYRNAAQLKREEKMLREVKENGENGNAAGKTEE